MSVCHILTGVGKEFTPARKERIERMCAVLGALEYDCKVYGQELCNPQAAENYEAQWGVSSGLQTSFAEAVAQILPPASDGGIIVATEGWHHFCFRGELNGTVGRFKSSPVIELWIDYPISFSWFRVFSTRFAMYDTAAHNGNSETWGLPWITAQPYYPAKKKDVFTEMVHEDKNPYSLEHMEALRCGVPVIAPDWGSWSETIEHGVTGYLYRTQQGKETGEKYVTTMRPEVIMDSVARRFSLDVAAEELSAFLSRASHA